MGLALERCLEMLPRNTAGGGMIPQLALICDHLLHHQAPDALGGDMAEIGLFKGFGASLMAGYLRKMENLVLIDIFCGLDHSSEAAAISEVAGAEALDRIKFHQTDSMLVARRGGLSEIGSCSLHRGRALVRRRSDRHAPRTGKPSAPRSYCHRRFFQPSVFGHYASSI